MQVKSKFLVKVLIGAFIIAVLIFSFVIWRNYQTGHTCMNCFPERTLSGGDYDGWRNYYKNCENFQNNKESAVFCLTNVASSWEANVSVVESHIKSPSLRIFNTILLSKTLPAYVFQGDLGHCRPSFAVDFKGKVYSLGGCLL